MKRQIKTSLGIFEPYITPPQRTIYGDGADFDLTMRQDEREAIRKVPFIIRDNLELYIQYCEKHGNFPRVTRNLFTINDGYIYPTVMEEGEELPKEEYYAVLSADAEAAKASRDRCARYWRRYHDRIMVHLIYLD